MTGTAETGAPPRKVNPLLPALTGAIPTLIFSIVALSIIFVASRELELTDRQLTTLIIGAYGLPGLLGLILTVIYRQPLIFAWNINSLVFLATLSDRFTYNEMLGATMVAGLLLALSGILGISARLAAVLPTAVVFGLLAGVLLPYVVGVFSELGQSPLLIGAPVLAFIVWRVVPLGRIPPMLPAIVVGVIAAAVLGEIQSPAGSWAFPELSGPRPEFSLAAILTISPVIAIFTGIQGNLVSTAYLEHQKYTPPRRLVDLSTGLTTMGISFFSVGMVSMAAILTPLTSGPDVGPHQLRHWSVYLSGAGFVLIGIFAGMAASWSVALPMSLLLALAGLSLFGILGQSLTEITRGPYYLGPLIAFSITLSDLTLLGLSNVFWAMVFGSAVALIIERRSGKS